MKKLLFSLPDILCVMDGGNEIEVTTRPFSCLWDVYSCVGGDDYAQIDVASVMSQDEDGTWVRDRVPNAVLAEMEERLQAELDQDRLRVARMNTEEAAA